MWSNHGHLAAPLGPGCDAGRDSGSQRFELRGRMVVASDDYDVCFVSERQANIAPGRHLKLESIVCAVAIALC